MLGVTCAPPALSGAVTVLLRTSEDGQAWSRWYDVELERVAEEGGPVQTCTEPIWTGAGRYVQLAARQPASDPTPSLLRDVRVVAIDTTGDAGTASALAGVAASRGGGGGRDRPHAAGRRHDHQAQDRHPRAVGRERVAALRVSVPTSPSRWRSSTTPTAATPTSPADAPAIVRGVYAYHTKAMHWSDVGYNFLIHRYGVIYEGRYGGMTGGERRAGPGLQHRQHRRLRHRHLHHLHPSLRSVTSLERLLQGKVDCTTSTRRAPPPWCAGTARSTRRASA